MFVLQKFMNVIHIHENCQLHNKINKRKRNKFCRKIIFTFYIFKVILYRFVIIRIESELDLKKLISPSAKMIIFL